MVQFLFEKIKTDGIFNGVGFCLWELLHTMSSPTTKAVNDSYINNMTLNNVGAFVGSWWILKKTILTGR